MPKPATPAGSKTGDDRNLVTVDENYLAPGLEDRLRLFWEKNSRLVLVVVVALALAIVGRGAYDYFAAQHQENVKAAYAAAATDAQLKQFIADNPDDPLTGAAQLRLAHTAYAAGDYAAAQAGYDQALPRLAGTPFAVTAQLGAAMARVEGGQTAEGEAALTRIANDATLPKGVRGEATYDLAAQAAAAGRADEVSRLTQQIVTLELEQPGPWTSRALALQSRLPASAAIVPAPPAAAPVATPATENKVAPLFTLPTKP